jgi:pyrroline-5-carboxylate reductase
MSDKVRRLGFLGAGNMAEALCRSVLASDLAEPESVMAYDPRSERTELLSSRLGIGASATPEKVLREAEVIVLAFKPQDTSAALSPLKEHFTPGHMVVSILAGVSTRYIESLLPPGVRVVRVMPNLLLTVEAGASALAGGRAATDEDVDYVRSLLGTGGKALVVEEGLLDVVTALSGSGPAYFFYLVEALVDGAEAHGLDATTARELAAATCLGAGKLLLETGDAPAAWRERVTSKGGTTAAALDVLERAGVKDAFVRAVAAATARAKELGQ